MGVEKFVGELGDVEGEAVERADLAQDDAGGEGEGLVAVEASSRERLASRRSLARSGLLRVALWINSLSLGRRGAALGAIWVVGRSARRGWAALQTLRPSWATVSLSDDAIPYCLPHGSAQHGSNAVSGCVA